MVLLHYIGMFFRVIILTLLYLFFGVSPIFAVTVTISNIPSTITDQPFNMDVAVSGAQANTTNYLRANLFPTGTTSARSWGHAASRRTTFCASCGSTFRGMTT